MKKMYKCFLYSVLTSVSCFEVFSSSLSMPLLTDEYILSNGISECERNMANKAFEDTMHYYVFNVIPPTDEITKDDYEIIKKVSDTFVNLKLLGRYGRFSEERIDGSISSVNSKFPEVINKLNNIIDLINIDASLSEIKSRIGELKSISGLAHEEFRGKTNNFLKSYINIFRSLAHIESKIPQNVTHQEISKLIISAPFVDESYSQDRKNLFSDSFLQLMREKFEASDEKNFAYTENLVLSMRYKMFIELINSRFSSVEDFFYWHKSLGLNEGILSPYLCFSCLQEKNIIAVRQSAGLQPSMQVIPFFKKNGELIDHIVNTLLISRFSKSLVPISLYCDTDETYVAFGDYLQLFKEIMGEKGVKFSDNQLYMFENIFPSKQYSGFMSRIRMLRDSIFSGYETSHNWITREEALKDFAFGYAKYMAITACSRLSELIKNDINILIPDLYLVFSNYHNKTDLILGYINFEDISPAEYFVSKFKMIFDVVSLPESMNKKKIDMLDIMKDEFAMNLLFNNNS